MRKIINNDDAYLLWVEQHPEGWVVNCENPPSARYLMLHRASCRFISTPSRTNWTSRAYIKVCGEDRRELEDWARHEVRGRLTLCGHCKP